MLDFLSLFFDVNNLLMYGVVILGIVLVAVSVASKFVPGLSMLPIFSMFSNTKVLLGIAGLVVLYFLYANSVDNAKKAALMDYNNTQLQLNMQQQQQIILTEKKIVADQQVIADNLVKQNNILNQKISNLTTYLSSDAAKKNDRPSSDILKHTIEILKGQQK